MGTDLTGVQSLDLQSLVVNDFQNLERQNTIINVDDSTSGDDLGDVLVVNVHDLVVTSLSVLVIGGEDHFVVWWDWVVNIVGGGTSSDFWTLGVQSNGQWSTWVQFFGLSGVVNDRLVVFVRTVREVHTDNVQTSLSQSNQGFWVVGLWTDGTNDGGSSQVRTSNNV